MTTSVDPVSLIDEGRTPRAGIGGLVGSADEIVLTRLARSLGHPRVLTDTPGFVADFDSCHRVGTPIDAGELERLARCDRLAEVEGAYAVAWTGVDGVLHLARDAVGERSLYYARAPGAVAFASTLRPLLDCGIVARTLNTSALPLYLSIGYLPAPETLAAGIFQLAPGSHVWFEHDQVYDEPLWSLPAEEPAQADEEIIRRRLRARLEQAVSCRLPPAGAVAATLSGGIDSSLVTALAARLHDGPVTTFSLSFGPGIPNELEYAAAVAAEAATEHHVVELLPRAVMDGFDDTIAALGTPIGEPLTVGNSVLFAAAADHAEVVLNGEGGDPCFGGPKNAPMILSDLYGPPASALRRGYLERSYLAAHRKCFTELHDLLGPELAGTVLEERIAPHLTDPRWSTLVNRLMALNVRFKGGHHILPKVDQLGRPHGVLPRSPLFDRGVVDAASRMPAQLKLRGAEEKVILKRAVADLLPAEVVSRPKSGMRVPVEAWLQGRAFERFARERLLDGLGPYGVIRRRYLEDLARPDRACPPRRRGAKIWLLLSLEAWLRTVLVPTEGA